LIEKYRNFITTPKTNDLLLNSSNIKRNEFLKRGETIRIIDNLIALNNIFKQITTEKKRNINYKHFISMKLENLLTNEATDEIIITEENNHSINTAQPLRSEIQTESMSNYLWGETIPMAYSRFLDIWNDKQVKQIDYSSSILFKFGNEVENRSRNNLIQRRLEPKQLMKLIDHLIQNKKQITRVKLIKKKSHHYSNQPDVLKTNDLCSNILALPLEVYLSVNI
jgi:hypothetical protein